MLKAYGVVEVRPKVGATIVDQRMNRAFDLFSFNVTEISRQTFDDIQGFRELIETGSVMQIFAAITPGDLARAARDQPRDGAGADAWSKRPSTTSAFTPGWCRSSATSRSSTSTGS